jgi:hypothetical protein
VTKAQELALQLAVSTANAIAAHQMYIEEPAITVARAHAFLDFLTPPKETP